jgi:histidyl-tRNA synthetase
VYVATVGEDAFSTALTLAQTLRQRGLRVAVDLEARSLKGQMRQANKERYRYSVILGSDELRSGQATLKDMLSGEQQAIALGEVVDRLTRLPEREYA